MLNRPTIELNRLIDEGGLNWFNIGLVVLSFFVVLLDGYDVSVMAYTAPMLVKSWHIESKAALGPVFSASLFGMLFGSPLLGYLGDNVGRKKAVAISCFLMGVATFATVLATSLPHLMLLRFVTGFGMGGLAPNVIALVSEYAPKPLRAKMVIIMYTGITFGGAVVGASAAWLVPQFGWQSLFFMGGVIQILMAGIVLAFMPESIKYLVSKHQVGARIEHLVSRLSKEKIQPGSVFVLKEEAKASLQPGNRPSIKALFSNGLAMATIPLWLCMASGLMGYYFLMNWLPTLLISAHMASSQAAYATAIFQIGGTIGGLTLSHQIDRKGIGAISFMYGAAIFVVGGVGFLSGIHSLLFCDLFLAGLCVLGLQFGTNAVASIVYPVAFRAYAIGWAFAVARIGAIVGPILGGIIIGMNLDEHEIFFFAAIPFIVGLISSRFLTRAYAAVPDQHEMITSIIE